MVFLCLYHLGYARVFIVSIWFRMVVSQIVIQVSKDSLTLRSEPNIRFWLVSQFWYPWVVLWYRYWSWLLIPKHSPTYQTNIGMFLLVQCDYWKSLVVLFGSSEWIMVLNLVLLDFFCSCGNTLWESMCRSWYVSACVRRYHYDVSSAHHHQSGSWQGTHSTITTLNMWFSGSLEWFLYFDLVGQSILNMFFWCPFLEPHLTTYHLKIRSY